MDTEIIVVGVDHTELTGKCFHSLLAYTTEVDYRLVWVDNGSIKDHRQKTAKAFADFPNRLSVWVGRNLGFAGGVNVGLRAIQAMRSPAKFVAIVHNDTMVSPGWLSRMMLAMKGNPKVGIAGLVSSEENADMHSWKEVFRLAGGKAMPNHFGGVAIESKSSFLGSAHKGHTCKTDVVGFFCALIRMEVIEKVGLLDETFDFGVDEDYCFRVSQAGYDKMIVLSAYADHLRGATFGTLFDEMAISEMLERGTEKLKTKHGMSEKSG